jgi:hypothetical protein
MITAHPMPRLLIVLLTLASASVPAQQTAPPKAIERDHEDFRLPSGKLQKDEILKADHEKTLADVAALAKAAEDLKIEVEKTDLHVLSISTLKQLDNIEKLTKRIRSRLKK